MKMPKLSRREQLLMWCAPIQDQHIGNRALRSTVHKVRKTDEFAHQRAFDQAVGTLVQAIPMPNVVTEWLSKGTFVATPRRTWKSMLQNPVVLAIGIAVGVIAGIF